MRVLRGVSFFFDDKEEFDKYFKERLDKYITERCLSFEPTYNDEYFDDYGYVLGYCLRNKVEKGESNGVTYYILTPEDIINLEARCFIDFVRNKNHSDEYLEMVEPNIEGQLSRTEEKINIMNLYDWIGDGNNISDFYILFVKQ